MHHECAVPSQYLPVSESPRRPGAAQINSRQPDTSSTLSFFVLTRRKSCHAWLPQSRRMVGRFDRLDLLEPSATGRQGHRPFVLLYIPKSRTRRPSLRPTAGSQKQREKKGWNRRSITRLIDTARGSHRHGTRLSSSADPQCPSHAVHASVTIAPQWGSAGPARRHHKVILSTVSAGRASARSSPSA